MIKKWILFLIGLFWFSCGEANTETKLDLSHVLITNNSNVNLTVTTQLITDDKNFKQEKDWNGYQLKLNPYESKEALWFRRLQNIKPNKSYSFYLMIKNEDYVNQNILVSFIEKGKPILSSNVTTLLSLPSQNQQIIFPKSGLYTFPGEFWSNNFIVHARSWLPIGNLYNSYHFVIDRQEKNSIVTPKKNEISLLTFNTQLMPFYAGVIDDLNQLEIRAQDIPEKITTFDVVILEELFDRNLRNTVIRLMNENFPYHTNVVGPHTDRFLTGGVMIFSKWPIVKEDQIVYRASAGIDSLAAKGAIYAVINKQGKTYHIIGTHVQAGSNHECILAKKAQIIELADFITKLNIPTDEPLLLGGDFNIDEFSEEVSTLLKNLSVSLVKNIGYPYSVDGTINGMQINKNKARIDYIFNSNKHAKPTHAYNKVFILRDLNNKNMWPKFDLSDHFPVMGYFNFE